MLGIQWPLQEQADHADHAAHGGPDLVAHAGQEVRLGPGGLLSLVGHAVSPQAFLFCAGPCGDLLVVQALEGDADIAHMGDDGDRQPYDKGHEEDHGGLVPQLNVGHGSVKRADAHDQMGDHDQGNQRNGLSASALLLLRKPPS